MKTVQQRRQNGSLLDTRRDVQSEHYCYHQCPNISKRPRQTWKTWEPKKYLSVRANITYMCKTCLEEDCVIQALRKHRWSQHGIAKKQIQTCYRYSSRKYSCDRTKEQSNFCKHFLNDFEFEKKYTTYFISPGHRRTTPSSSRNSIKCSGISKTQPKSTLLTTLFWKA